MIPRRWLAVSLGGLVVCGVLMFGTCRERQPRRHLPEQVSAGPDRPDEPAPSPRRPRYARSSRCGECHERMRSDWLTSAHARASTSPAFTRALSGLDEEGKGLCFRCHLPGLPFGQPAETDQAGRPSEGVSCDGCHALSAVAVDATGGQPAYDLASGRKYGPLPDPASNYFHGMAKSDLHARSEQCAGCHHLLSFTLGAEARNIPVVTDYAGWKLQGKEGPGRAGKTCQGCHMPAHGPGPVARGSRVRPEVPSHAFPGAGALSKALRMDLSIDRRAGRLGVELSHTAGHPVPAGYVDRRLILRVVFHDHGGAEVGREERSYGIRLVDQAGRPAPFWKAARVEEDRRLDPGKTYLETFELPGGAARPARVEISLVAAPTAPELADTYGPPALQVLRTASHSLASPRPGHPEPTPAGATPDPPTGPPAGTIAEPPPPPSGDKADAGQPPRSSGALP